MLDLLSKSDVRSIIKPQLEDQYFWYQRTENMFNLPDWLQWDENSQENWKQIYNILASIKKGINPFHSRDSGFILERNGYNTKAVQYLLHFGYNPSVDSSRSLVGASQYGSPEVVQLLLSDPRIDPTIEGRESEYAIREAAALGRLDIMQVLLDDPRMQNLRGSDRAYMIHLGLSGAARTNQVEATKLLLRTLESDSDRYPIDKIQSDPYASLVDRMELNTYYEIDEILHIAIDNDSLEVFKLLMQIPNNDLTRNVNYITRAAEKGSIRILEYLQREEETYPESS